MVLQLTMSKAKGLAQKRYVHLNNKFKEQVVEVVEETSEVIRDIVNA